MGYDEMNVAASAGNYGWPFFIGYDRPYPRTDNGPPPRWGAPQDPAHPVNDSPNNTGLRDLPPTLVSDARTWRTSELIRLDFPTPGGPVTPIA